MLTAFYTGVKSVIAKALVVTARHRPVRRPVPEQAPPHARALRPRAALPAAFEGQAAPTTCATPARFDLLAHHPYSVGAPTRHALNADDVSIPDIVKLTKILRAAERAARMRFRPQSLPAGRLRAARGWRDAEHAIYSRVLPHDHYR
jgi:hypothetical protein